MKNLFSVFKGCKEKREYFVWSMVYTFLVNIMFSSVFPLVYRELTVGAPSTVYMVGMSMSTILGLVISIVLVHDSIRIWLRTYVGVFVIVVVETVIETIGFILVLRYGTLSGMLLAVIITSSTTTRLVYIGSTDLYKIKYIAEDQISFGKYQKLIQYIGAVIGGLYGVVLATASSDHYVYSILMRNIASILMSTAVLYDLYLVKKIK